MNNPLDSADRLLDLAAQFRTAGEPGRALKGYETVIDRCMYLSFAACECTDELKTWLADRPFEAAVQPFLQLSAEIFAAREPHWERHFHGYRLLALSHLFAALGQHERAYVCAQIAAEPIVYDTPFWAEYTKTYWALLEGGSHAPAFGKLKGMESHWAEYVALMEAGIRQTGVEAALAQVDKGFERRNRDKRIHDVMMIDGSGHKPVKFDFRSAGILAAMEARGSPGAA